MDYYLEHPPRQPKAEIADYVESNGILVPRRFATIADARKSGLPILARSEHPQDYAGVSGLLSTNSLMDFDADTSENLRFQIRAKETKSGNSTALVRYCELLNLNYDDEEGRVSYSLWENIYGYNHTIVADPAVENRYHIMSSKNDDLDLSYILSGGDSFFPLLGKTPLIAVGLQSLIHLYEKTRTLPRFDPKHCPIMEIQSDNDQNYFLQTHRGMDFNLSSWTLKEVPQGYSKAEFVVCATSPEGITLNTTLYYGKYDEALRTNEDASFDSHWRDMFTEAMVRRRRAQFTLCSHGLEYQLVKIVSGHNSRSTMFKTPLSVVVAKTFFNDICDKLKFKDLLKSEKDVVGKIHVISDGRQAYVKHIE